MKRKKYPIGGPWKLRRVVRVMERRRIGEVLVTTVKLECRHKKTSDKLLLVDFRTRCYPCGRELAQLHGDQW